MKYTFNQPDEKSTSGSKTIEIAPERWIWLAIYDDETQLAQFGKDGKFHQIGEIDRPRVKMFGMLRLDKPDEMMMFETKGREFFHLYRNLGLDYGNEHRKYKIYVFGFKGKDGEPDEYNFILPGDKVIMTDRDCDVSRNL
jgi:hypothetical protein